MDDYRLAVYEIQKKLRALSRQYPEIGNIVPDGIYGEETAQAVRVFQRLYGLPVMGRVDIDTWNALMDAGYTEELIQVVPITVKDLPLQKGDSSMQVAAAQSMLMYIAENFSNIPPTGVDGIFGESTVRAVIEWQGVTFLPRTGEIDGVTWNRLAQFYTMT